MTNELVSIIVPCYMQGAYLNEAVESILQQTYSNWECIIVNDGSTDNSEEIAKKYCQIDDRIRYISQPNQGVSNTRNNGIKVSSGKYILPLDADDKIAPTYVEKAVECLDEHEHCKLVYCHAEFFGCSSGPWVLPDYSYSKFIWDNCIFCSAMFRRADYDKTIGYNPNMTNGLEDWDFWLSLLKPEDEVLCLDEVLFYYRIKNKSRTTVLYQDGLNNMFRQVYYNHRDIYDNYVSDIFSLKHSVMDRDKQILELQKSLTNIQYSRSYKLARVLSWPYRFINTFFRNWLNSIRKCFNFTVTDK